MKLVNNMSSREKRLKRKQWRLNSSVYKEKNKNVCKNLSTLLVQMPSTSLVPLSVSSIRNNDTARRDITLRRRRLLRNRRAILYGIIAKLKNKLKEEIRKKEKYRKKCIRMNKKKNYLHLRLR